MLNNSQIKLIKMPTSSSIWLLLIGASFITLYFDTEVADPFNTPKQVMLLIIATWLSGHLIINFLANKTLKNSDTVIPFGLTILFIVSLLISTLFSDVVFVSFIGETQRRNGFFTYLGLVIIFMYSILSLRNQMILRFFKVSIFTGLIVGLYGLFQVSGRDFVDWNNPYNSMISTLGNPNFASASLAIFATTSLLVINLKSFSKLLKITAIVATSVALFCIVFSDSRQGLIALIFSSVFYFSTLLILKNRKLGILNLVFVILAVLFSILGMLQKGPFTQILYKDSVSVRGFYWRAAVEMFKNNPLLGVGVDRYGAYFREFREVEYTSRYGYEIYSTNAHNTFLQLFSTGGFFVGFFYVLIQSYVLIKGIRSAAKLSGDQQKIILILLAAWLAYQAQSFISIDNIGIAVWGWLIGGAVLGASFSLEDGRALNFKEDRKSLKKSPKPINLFQPFVSSVLMLPTLFLCINLYSAESNLYKLKIYATNQKSDNQALVKTTAEKIIASRFIDPYYKFQATGFLFEIGSRNEAFIEVKNLHNRDPRNLDYLKGLAYLSEYNGDIEGAIKYRIKISQFDPWNAPNYLELVKLSKKFGDLNNAEKYLERILEFAGETDLAKSAQELLT
jgi:O-antigen ligase